MIGAEMIHTRMRKAPFAVRAGLGLILALGSCATPMPAFAENATITINQQHNDQASYDAYQLFTAEVDEQNQASHLSWASDAVRDTVLEFLDANGYGTWLADSHPGDGRHDQAQVAAEYVSEMIETSPHDENAGSTPPTPAAGSFATKLAQELATSNVEALVAHAGEPFTGSEGYWLFVTKDATTQDYSEAGTAPLWLLLGGSLTTVNEKTDIPAVDKDVLEDSDKVWGKTADAQVGQNVSYRLTGTLPSNYGAFDSYHYQFIDTLSRGLDLVIADGQSAIQAVSVSIDGNVVPVDGANLTVSYQDRVLTVDFANLKDDCWHDYAIDSQSVFTVEYEARLNGECLIGAEGNPNDVWLTYTDDPVSLHDGRTKEVPVKVFTYKIQVLKSDQQTDEPLEGAGFTVRVDSTNSDSPSSNKYVQADGKLSDTPYQFVTNAQGTFDVQGLDEGTYLITEEKAPEGYELTNQVIRLNVTSKRDNEGRALAKLEASVTKPDGSDCDIASISTIDGNAGTIYLTATNDRYLKMPLTGLPGLPHEQYMAVAAVGTVSIGLWHQRNKRSQSS